MGIVFPEHIHNVFLLPLNFSNSLSGFKILILHVISWRCHRQLALQLTFCVAVQVSEITSQILFLSLRVFIFSWMFLHHFQFYIRFFGTMVPIQSVDSVLLLLGKVFSNFTLEYFFNFIVFISFKDTNYAGFRSPLCSISIIFFLVLSTLWISIDCYC